MLDKWSIRHRADFAKHSTRLARYLTENHEKAPYFVKVVEILSTDSKVYTFMEVRHLMDSSITYFHHFFQISHWKAPKRYKCSSTH